MKAGRRPRGTLFPALPPPNIVQEKAALRRELRRRRASLPLLARRRAALRLAYALDRLGWLKPGRKLAAYIAVGSELSLTPLIELALQRGVEVYLPVLPRRGRRMRFARLGAKGGVWRNNRYQIPEYHAPQTITARQLDLVLLPLVGFDAQGGRLGQGGGFYDCTFAFRRSRQHWNKPRLIGIGFECQRLDLIPSESHDAPLDYVLSEQAIYRQGRVQPLPA